MRNLAANHPRGTWLVSLGIGLAAAATVLLLLIPGGARGAGGAGPAALVSPASPIAAHSRQNDPPAAAAPSKGDAGLSVRMFDAQRAALRKRSAVAPHDTAAISELAANGIPATALNAYRVAAARVDHADPGCGIDWALLAGVGRVESDHGQFAGAVLHADGLSTPKIIGPALNGHGDQYIPAPSNGVSLDGDAKYTHALGPMQFIPQTWAEYGADANGDGVADIFNINDAALGAARYLCAAGGDLATQAGQARAVFAYNHSDRYVAEVLALAAAYRSGIPITGLPIGNVTGELKPTPKNGAPPPANPGQPIGVSDKPKPKKQVAAAKHASASPSSTLTSSAAPTGSTSSGGTATAPAPGATAAPTPSSPVQIPIGTHPSSGSPSSPSAPSPTCRVVLLGQCLGQ